MPSSGLRHSLEQEGFALVPGALAPNQVERLREAFARPAPETGTEHVTIDAETPHREEWEGLHGHASVSAAREIVLPGAVHFDCSGRNPLPGFGAQGLHTDAPVRRPGTPAQVLTAIFMLDDFTTTNGATRIVPGSHRIFAPIPKSLAQPGARHEAETLALGGAGTLLVFDGHLWHAGGRNASEAGRRAVQLVVRRRPK